MERSRFVGIDVSRDCLDVAFRPDGKRAQVSNDRPGITRLIRMLERSKPELVVLEASGGYEIAALERLLAKKIPVALLNPRHVHNFARASGRLAKTDVIDAEVLAHFADVMKPSPTRLADPETRTLRAFVNRRQAAGPDGDCRAASEPAFAGSSARRLCRDPSLLEERDRVHRQADGVTDWTNFRFSPEGRAAANCAWHRRRCSSDAACSLTRAR